jgi:hypothetical protein
MNKLLKYKLIGIGEFSHGIEESWDFRFKLLKYAMKNTNKKIFIFNEMSYWQANNIMNNTIWSRELNKPINYKGIKKEKPFEGGEGYGSWGKLWQYMGHSLESKIFLKIIKYIRKYKDRITLIGIDNDTMDRDYDAYKIIMKYYNPNNINFFWAHNHHVNNQPYHHYNLKYIKNKSHKWYCGHYLKKKLKDDYCIILSQAYDGENRFNGYCMGKDCHKRTWQLKYFYKKFSYPKNKKYINKKEKYQLLTEYNEPFINFSNSYFKNNKYGEEAIDKNNKTWDFVLFWNKVHRLIPVYNY